MPWYAYDFDIVLVSIVEPTVGPRWNHLNDGAVLTDRKLLEGPVIFVEGETILLSEARPQVLQFFAAWYPADLEESLAATLEKVISIDILAGGLEGEAD